MKQTSIRTAAVIWVWTLGSGFAADEAYWAGTETSRPGWQLPVPSANGPLWGGTNGHEAGRMFETRQQLLHAINVWMKSNHRSEITMDDLVIRIAAQVNFAGPNPRLNELLRDLVKNEHFKLPVELWADSLNEVTLPKQDVAGERLALPDHRLLSIRFRNYPWGSKDSEGIPVKVVSWDFPIAYAVGR